MCDPLLPIFRHGESLRWGVAVFFRGVQKKEKRFLRL